MRLNICAYGGVIRVKPTVCEQFVCVIDRIDRYKDRAIVIDYKSKYNIDFAPSNIIYGDRIQLFVYLNALLNNECLTPQGVFYLLMNNRFVKGGDDFEKRFMHKGFVNSDENLVNDLDKGFESGGNFSSLVYPIKRKVTKDNASLEAQKSGYALSTEQFKKTCDYVIKLTSKAAKEIEEGYIAKSPLAIDPKDDDIKVCAYCNYRNVCDRSILKVRKVKDIKIPQKNIIKGDSKSASIAAASILAKVERDEFMKKISIQYPNYHWEKNKGYLSKEHIEAIKKYGITKYHRKSFLKNILN